MDLVLGVKKVEVKQPDGSSISLAKIARWNEWGTELIPPRPAFRMGMERAIKKNKKRISAFLKNSIKARYRGDKSYFKKLEKVFFTSLGQQAASETKKIIDSGETVANAPATIAKKGFDHPLFHTGTLLKNVTYEVQE